MYFHPLKQVPAPSRPQSRREFGESVNLAAIYFLSGYNPLPLIFSPPENSPQDRQVIC